MNSLSPIDLARQQVKVLSIAQYVSLVPVILIAIMMQIPDFLVLSPEAQKLLPWILAGIALLDFAIMRFILNRAKQRLRLLDNEQN